jgi:DNA-binding Xre family transcriptional regulator
VTNLQKKIAQETGVVISNQQLCKIVNSRPKLLRFETAEILCSALRCELSDFLTITGKVMDPASPRKLSYKNTPRCKIGIKAFPVPADYKSSEK